MTKHDLSFGDCSRCGLTDIDDSSPCCESEQAGEANEFTEGELYICYMALRTCQKAGFELDSEDEYPEVLTGDLERYFLAEFNKKKGGE